MYDIWASRPEHARSEDNGRRVNTVYDWLKRSQMKYKIHILIMSGGEIIPESVDWTKLLMLALQDGHIIVLRGVFAIIDCTEQSGTTIQEL